MNDINTKNTLKFAVTIFKTSCIKIIKFLHFIENMC